MLHNAHLRTASPYNQTDSQTGPRFLCGEGDKFVPQLALTENDNQKSRGTSSCHSCPPGVISLVLAVAKRKVRQGLVGCPRKFLKFDNTQQFLELSRKPATFHEAGDSVLREENGGESVARANHASKKPVHPPQEK
jgi:hypothetical protein